MTSCDRLVLLLWFYSGTRPIYVVDFLSLTVVEALEVRNSFWFSLWALSIRQRFELRVSCGSWAKRFSHWATPGCHTPTFHCELRILTEPWSTASSIEGLLTAPKERTSWTMVKMRFRLSTLPMLSVWDRLILSYKRRRLQKADSVAEHNTTHLQLIIFYLQCGNQGEGGSRWPLCDSWHSLECGWCISCQFSSWDRSRVTHSTRDYGVICCLIGHFCKWDRGGKCQPFNCWQDNHCQSLSHVNNQCAVTL